MKKSVLMTLFLSFPVAACGGGTKDVAKPDPEKMANACAEYTAPAGTAKWMSWEDGIDVAGMTEAGLQMPNVIIHVARNVNTPVGSAASGMLLYQPDPKGAPAVIGFVSTDEKVGAYFGPNIFAGTPFETAPALKGTISVTFAGDTATSRTEVGGHVFEVEMTKVSSVAPIDRQPAAFTPFTQKGTEAAVGEVTVKVDGKKIEMTVLPTGISGGPGAVWSPCGVYAR